MTERDPHGFLRIIPPPAEFHDWHGGRVKGTRRNHSDAVATLAIVAVFVGAFTGAVHYPASALARETRPLIAEIGKAAHQLANHSTAFSAEYARRASAALANMHIASDIEFSPRLQLAAAAETADSFASYVGSLWRQLFGAFSQIVATPEYVRTPGVTELVVGSSTTTPTRTVGTTAVAPIQQTIINQPVIERVFSAPVASGISQSSLTTQLALLRDDLLLRIASSLTGAAPSAQTNFQSFAASQRIDQLTGTSLTNITVSGVSGLTDSDIPDGITAANYLPLIGGTLTGNLTLSGVLSAGSLLVSTISSGGAIEAPYFTATSTTASSTFPNLNATNATTTNATSTNQYAAALVAGNATSTNFFSTLGRFTTGIFDTLLTAASASITNLTATTLTATNATTTRLDALEYVAVGGSATTTIRGDGVASTIPYASSTAVTVSGTASTSNLIASTGFTFKTVTGFLKASAGIVSEALVDLAANVTGILPVANGGTGWAAIQSGTIPYGNGSSAFATSSAFTFDGTKLIATYASTTALTSSGSAYFATSGGNVGVGTTSPWAQLSINPTSSNGTAPSFVIGSSTATNFIVTNAGNVGIGVTSPEDKLDIAATDNPKIRFVDTGNYEWKIGIAENNKFQFTRSGSDTQTLTMDSSGNVGIGTPTPSATLEVCGTSASTYGPLRLRNTGTASGKYWQVGPDPANEFVVYNQSNSGVWIGDGQTAWIANSDERLKTNITSLASSSLDQILALNPVTYDWKSVTAATTTQYGFIAQEVQTIFPDFVSHGPDTVITNADGSTTTIASPLGLNYTGFIVPAIKAIQELATLGATFKDTLIAWLGDAGNGIVTIFADTLFAKRVQTAQLCAEKSDGTTFCVTGDQLADVLSGASSIHPSEPVPSADPGTSTPPTITIAGENPATIQIGDTYSDLGAIAKDSEGHDLSYRTFINGVLSRDILIDTSAEATDTVDYVATDTWGNTATSTRTVIVEAVAATVVATDANTSTSTSSATSSPLSE